MAIKKGEVDIVIGARSAIFAPFNNIGAIIIDEEHETTYKSDMTPKYDTIEVAIKRAIQESGVVVLGSATPSVISNYRAECKIYGKIELKNRYNNTPMPQIQIVDMRQELETGNKSIFSNELYNKTKESLDSGKQVILFLNRRGYSPFISCRKCGYVMRCPECGISMTYHKSENIASCHFCGRRETPPNICPSCGSKYLKHFGVGTEKVEEITKELFPEVEVARLDLDTSARKGSVNKILNDFRKGRTKILIGTQMIAKGLDFDNVELVGAIAADVSLNIPDFRSGERTFQLTTQVAGRSGRRHTQGQVIIQTYMPDNYAILAAANHDYPALYNNEILLRKTFDYPPFTDIIRVTVVSESEENIEAYAQEVKNLLFSFSQNESSDYVLGPNPAPVFKVRDEYRYYMYIKSSNNMRKKHEILLSQLKRDINTNKKKDFRVIIEINPFNMY
jgi:primosomal protein N' (replication factor Y)